LLSFTSLSDLKSQLKEKYFRFLARCSSIEITTNKVGIEERHILFQITTLFKNTVENLRFRYFIDDQSQFIAGSHCEHENTSLRFLLFDNLR